MVVKAFVGEVVGFAAFEQVGLLIVALLVDACVLTLVDGPADGDEAKKESHGANYDDDHVGVGEAGLVGVFGSVRVCGASWGNDVDGIILGH